MGRRFEQTCSIDELLSRPGFSLKKKLRVFLLKVPCVCISLVVSLPSLSESSDSGQMSEASVWTRNALSKSGGHHKARFPPSALVRFLNVKSQVESLFNFFFFFFFSFPFFPLATQEMALQR